MDPREAFPLTYWDRSSNDGGTIGSVEEFHLYIEEVYFDSDEYTFTDRLGREVKVEFQIWTGKLYIRLASDDVKGGDQ